MSAIISRKKVSFLIGRRLSNKVDCHSVELKFESMFPFHQILLDLTFDSQDLFSISPGNGRSLGTVMSVEPEWGSVEAGPDPTVLGGCCPF